MTHDERISSYIDNEFTAEQEQEFLISLAASEGLRKSFRSELVLKNVLHRDEAATVPPRRLRAAVFATLGLGAATLGANKANAAQSASIPSRGLVKAFFATKMSTLVTIAGLSVSAIAGYGVRTVLSPAAEVSPVSHLTTVSHVTAPAQPSVSQPMNAVIPAPMTSSVPATHVMKKSLLTARPHHSNQNASAAPSEPVNGMAGGGTIGIEPPKINPAH